MGLGLLSHEKLPQSHLSTRNSTRTMFTKLIFKHTGADKYMPTGAHTRTTHTKNLRCEKHTCSQQGQGRTVTHSAKPNPREPQPPSKTACVDDNGVDLSIHRLLKVLQIIRGSSGAWQSEGGQHRGHRVTDAGGHQRVPHALHGHLGANALGQGLAVVGVGVGTTRHIIHLTQGIQQFIAIQGVREAGTGAGTWAEGEPRLQIQDEQEGKQWQRGRGVGDVVKKAKNTRE